MPCTQTFVSVGRRTDIYESVRTIIIPSRILKSIRTDFIHSIDEINISQFDIVEKCLFAYRYFRIATSGFMPDFYRFQFRTITESIIA